jgi:hypothetical protein
MSSWRRVVPSKMQVSVPQLRTRSGFRPGQADWKYRKYNKDAGRLTGISFESAGQCVGRTRRGGCRNEEDRHNSAPLAAGTARDCDAGVYDLLAAANALMNPIGLNLTAGSVQRWRSDDAVAYISSQLISAERQAERTPSNLFLAITGQRTVSFDGYAVESETRAIVRFYPERREHTASLVAHEVGHLLGAKHHEDDDECTGHGCVMDRSGYASATTWCDHHTQQIREYLTSNLVTFKS